MRQIRNESSATNQRTRTTRICAPYNIACYLIVVWWYESQILFTYVSTVPPLRRCCGHLGGGHEAVWLLPSEGLEEPHGSGCVPQRERVSTQCAFIALVMSCLERAKPCLCGLVYAWFALAKCVSPCEGKCMHHRECLFNLCIVVAIVYCGCHSSWIGGHFCSVCVTRTRH